MPLDGGIACLYAAKGLEFDGVISSTWAMTPCHTRPASKKTGSRKNAGCYAPKSPARRRSDGCRVNKLQRGGVDPAADRVHKQEWPIPGFARSKHSWRSRPGQGNVIGLPPLTAVPGKPIPGLPRYCCNGAGCAIMPSTPPRGGRYARR